MIFVWLNSGETGKVHCDINLKAFFTHILNLRTFYTVKRPVNSFKLLIEAVSDFGMTIRVLLLLLVGTISYLAAGNMHNGSILFFCCTSNE